MAKPRKKPGTQSYILHGIPVDLWEAAKAKAASQEPPMSMRWAILLLLKDWIYSAPGSKHKSPGDTEKPQMF